MYDEMGLSSYAHLIIFMFLGDGYPACLFDSLSWFNQDLFHAFHAERSVDPKSDLRDFSKQNIFYAFASNILPFFGFLELHSVLGNFSWVKT